MTINLSEAISDVCARPMQQQWMEEHCVTFLHFQPYSVIFLRVIALHTMVHHIYTMLKEIRVFHS